MANIEPFEKYYKEYDDWFIKNENIYLSELKTIKSLIPKNKRGVEIGVGSGRFALPLGIKVGIEPSKKMGAISVERGIQIYNSVAEYLPFKNNIFDFILMVTTICFLDDLYTSLKEAFRVLKTNGFIIIGFIDKNSELGLKYQSKKLKSKFYNHARFYSVEEVIDLLRKAHFNKIEIKRMVLNDITNQRSYVKNNCARGGFIVIKAVKLDLSKGGET